MNFGGLDPKAIKGVVVSEIPRIVAGGGIFGLAYGLRLWSGSGVAKRWKEYAEESGDSCLAYIPAIDGNIDNALRILAPYAAHGEQIRKQVLKVTQSLGEFCETCVLYRNAAHDLETEIVGDPEELVSYRADEVLRHISKLSDAFCEDLCQPLITEAERVLGGSPNESSANGRVAKFLGLPTERCVVAGNIASTCIRRNDPRSMHRLIGLLFSDDKAEVKRITDEYGSVTDAVDILEGRIPGSADCDSDSGGANPKRDEIITGWVWAATEAAARERPRHAYNPDDAEPDTPGTADKRDDRDKADDDEEEDNGETPVYQFYEGSCTGGAIGVEAALSTANIRYPIDPMIRSALVELTVIVLKTRDSTRIQVYDSMIQREIKDAIAFDEEIRSVLAGHSKQMNDAAMMLENARDTDALFSNKGKRRETASGVVGGLDGLERDVTRGYVSRRPDIRPIAK